jgi:hypothetical protein
LLATLLALAGAAVALYSLWQLRRWLAEGETSAAAVPRRLEALVDELLVTAETTSTVVQDKAEALAVAIAEADRRLEALRAIPMREATTAALPREVPAATVPIPPPLPDPVSAVPAAAVPVVPDLHRQVYGLTDAGQDVTAVARKLGLTKGEVQLILGLRQNGQGAK